MGDQNFPFAEGAYGPFAAPIVPSRFHPGDTQGQVFYVNANATGADDVDDPWPEVDETICFSTLQAAINACVDNRGDTIYVKKGGEVVTSTVLFDCPGIRVITQRYGMAPSMRGEFTSIYSTTLTGDPTAIISQPCYIEGLGFVGADAGTTFYSGAALLLRVDAASAATTKPWGVHLNQCRFPGWSLGQTCGLAMDGGTNVLIEDCYFEDAAFTHGIYIQGAAGHVQIKDCHFCLGTYAIKFGAFSDAGVNTQLEIGPGNVTVTPTRGINTGSNACKAQVFGNYWGVPVATAYDQTVDNMESDGYICSGNYYADEERDDE
jgi:hypothetical protein